VQLLPRFHAAAGDEIDASRIPRITASQPAKGEPKARHDAVVRNCSDRVVGTTGIETARRGKERGEHQLIGANEPDDELHRFW
jgi:hypothetical protein